MNLRTGKTVNEIFSLTSGTGATAYMFVNGLTASTPTLGVIYSNHSGYYKVGFQTTAGTGMHQFIIDDTLSGGTVQKSQIYNVLPDIEILPNSTVYIGL